ncbi:hypothetical protein [Endozoicomonas lisbonensis]|uniref:DNA repair exonuclease SbcCD ATPase subunit n=1 Tax=Endozoicomonas lisbonensis TaxID=3120522 RepID=A0ABV2SGP1_9GAMM
MATINSHPGAVTSIQGRAGQENARQSDTGRASSDSATNSERFNRSGITPEKGKAMLRMAPSQSSIPKQSSIQERKAERLPADKVKTQLSDTRSEDSSASLEGNLEELARDVKYFRNNRRKAESKGSENEYKRQIQQLDRELQVVRRLKNNVKDIAKMPAMADYSFIENPGSGIASQAHEVLRDARAAVTEAKQELAEAKEKLSVFKSGQRSTRRLHNAFRSLQKSVLTFNQEPSGSLNSVRDHTRHVRSLDSQLSRAKAILSGSEKLLQSERKASARGIELPGFREQVQKVHSQADSEVNRLKQEITTAKDSRKSAKQQEKQEKAELRKAKRQARQEEQAISPSAQPIDRFQTKL